MDNSDHASFLEYHYFIAKFDKTAEEYAF